MLPFFTALALIVVTLLGSAGAIRLLVNPGSALWRARGRMRETATVRRASADLDREYASLVDEYRDLAS